MKPVCMLKNYKQNVPSQYGASHSNNLWFFNGMPISWQQMLKETENSRQAIPSSSTLFKINPLHHAQHVIVDTLQINSQSDRRLKGNTNVSLRLLIYSISSLQCCASNHLGQENFVKDILLYGLPHPKSSSSSHEKNILCSKVEREAKYSNLHKALWSIERRLAHCRCHRVPYLEIEVLVLKNLCRFRKLASLLKQIYKEQLFLLFSISNYQILPFIWLEYCLKFGR